jgi:two-component system, NtrC family, sensor kinase
MPHGSAQYLLASIIDRIEVGVFAVDPELNVMLWNGFMATHSGREASDVVGKPLFETFPELPQKWLEKKFRSVFLLRTYAFTSWEQRPWLFRFQHNRPVTGGIDAMQQSCTFLPIVDGETISHVCVTLFDHTDAAVFQYRLKDAIVDLEREKEEQRRLIAKLDTAQSQLLQSEKLASIGQLAAGVAHEINNPIGFINSNVGTLENYVNDLLRLIEALETDADAAAKLKGELDFEFLQEDVVSLIRESKDGLDRVKRIVQDLKDFSHVDSSPDWQRADIHKCLDSTLNVVANELKYKAQVLRHYGQLPEVECLPSQLNQVFLNLLVNAGQAIRDKGTITISTGTEGEWAWVAVADQGVGIPADVLKRIFDPFFTTKPVGKGTGLGLSVSYNIVGRHNGRIEVESQVGVGTTFRVWLPIRQSEAAVQP